MGRDVFLSCMIKDIARKLKKKSSSGYDGLCVRQLELGSALLFEHLVL